MNVLPAGLTPPIGVRRTITDECFGMWASSSVYSIKHDRQSLENTKQHGTWRLSSKSEYKAFMDLK